MPLKMICGIELTSEPITLEGHFGQPETLVHQLPEATVELTATFSRVLLSIEDEYTGRPKSEAYLAIAALALMLVGSFLFISRVARKRGEKF